MAITSIKTGSSFTNLQKYNDFLGPNAAFFPSSYESIATITTGTGNFSFTSIPSTYKHLQLRINFLTTNVGSPLGIRFNNDTSSIYAYHRLTGDGSSAGAGGQASDSYIGLFYDKGFVGTYPNVAIIDIIDYASTTKNKTLRSFAGNDNNSTGGEVYLESGLWASTAAINRIDSVFMSGNSSVTYSLYGIN
jgi:hypothetical protein